MFTVNMRCIPIMEKTNYEQNDFIIEKTLYFEHRRF